MSKRSFYIINGITLYRLFSAPLLVFLVYTGKYDAFKWMLGISFFTDLIDGYLARKFKVASVFGSKLDSIADDLTVVAGIVGLFVFKRDFIERELIVIIILLSFFLIESGYALIKYKKITSFHTYGAKLAALLQGVFLILCFFLPEPSYPLFYLAAIVTSLELLEEIVIIVLLPKWEANVKGLYWVLRKMKPDQKDEPK